MLLKKLLNLTKKIICLVVLCIQISMYSALEEKPLIKNNKNHPSFFQKINDTVNTIITRIKNLFIAKNYAVIEYANKRYSGRMEDRHTIDENSIYAVFDGHGGQSAAQYIVDSNITGNNIVSNKTPRIVSYINDALQEKIGDAQALKISLARIENELWNNSSAINMYGYLSPYYYGEKEEYGASGATAIVAKKTDHILTVANVGDSRAVLIRNGKIIQTTIDHKPSLDTERKRVLQAGASISGNYVKFGGFLGSFGFALTRTIGDINAKKVTCDQTTSHPTVSDCLPILSAEPDIYTWSVEKNDILLLASDGLWDVMDSSLNANDNSNLQKYLNQINQKQETINLDKIVKDLKIEAVKKGSRDNITILVVRF